MKNFILTLLVLILANDSIAQIRTAVLLPEKKDTVVSNYLGRTQQLLINVPDEYERSGLKYPVIIYFDAQDGGLKNLVLSNIDQLMYNRNIPRAIVIGIPHQDRGSDLSIERSEVDSTPFFKFVTQELMAFIKKNYRTLDFRTFIGHSLGGQFVCYGMTRCPEVFNSVIAISPALNYAETELWFKRKTLSALEAFSHGVHQNHLYFCVGDAGFQDSGFKYGSLELSAILKKANNPGIHWKFDLLNSFTHGSTPAAGIPLGLVQVFKYWPFPEQRAYEVMMKNQGNALQEVLAHEKAAKKIYGVEIPLPRSVYWQFGKYELEKGNYRDALVFFEKNIALDPTGVIPRSLMGDVLAKMGKKAEAKACYEKAISLLKAGESKKELEEKIRQLDVAQKAITSYKSQ